MDRENQELEQQRRKLETLGRLAGNVVHDFNNLLMVIEGYTRMLLEEPNLGEAAQESAQEILKAADRAAALTRQLLAFSRKKPVESHEIDLNAQLHQMRNMLMRLLGETVRLEYDLSPEPSLIFANHSQVEQVLLNLIVNARDAAPIGGRILVRTAVHPDRVELIVEDNGVGIPEEILPKIFEPFFTTKEAGQGTGIGLALVAETVTEWGGKIEVSSRLKQGSQFRIEAPRMVKLPPAAADLDDKHGVILLVEDEDGVRALIGKVLDRSYEVLESATEVGALEIARLAPRLDLLVTDLDLKEGEGRRLAGLVRLLHPGIKIILISGSAPELEGEGDMMLQKPFSPNTLVLAVQHLLKSEFPKFS